MTLTDAAPASVSSPSEADHQTFCTYLAKQFIARKGFGVPQIPELQKLAASSDIVLAYSDGYSLTILCMVDREKTPDRIFTASTDDVEEVGKACLKYTGRVNSARMPVKIVIMEVGPGAADQRQRLGRFARSWLLSKVVPSAMTVDTASGTVWSSSKTWLSGGGYQDFIATLLASPRESDADLTPPVVLIAPASFPILTTALLAVLVAVFGAEIAYGTTGGPAGSLEPSMRTLVAFGASVPDLVLKSGEWYRLFSAPFLHADPIHLAMNAIGLFLAGRILERLVGRAWFGAVYAVAALCGACLSLLFHTGSTVAVGASGAIMGLFAAVLVAGEHFPPGAMRASLRTNALYVLIPSLLPLASAMKGSQKVDFAAHFGGAIGGAAVAFVMLNVWPRSEALPRLTKAAAAIAIAGVLALAYPALSILQHVQAAGVAPQLQAVSPAPQPQAMYPVPQSQAVDPVPQHRAVSPAPQLKLIPPDLLPQTAANMKAQAAWLAKYFPRDPRLHLYKATELLNTSDFRGAEQEAQAGLAEEELWRSMLSPEVAQNLRIVLAVAVSPDRQSEAQAIARPVCAAVSNGPMRKMLDDRKLCGA
jgi:rhomboid protease GluP